MFCHCFDRLVGKENLFSLVWAIKIKLMGRLKPFFLLSFQGALLSLTCIHAHANLSDEDRDFERARVLLQSGQESEALLSATDFLRRYPQSARADDAQYFVGEVYYRRRQFQLALEEYSKIPGMKNPGLDKISEAGLRMGECWIGLGDKTRAKIEWEAVLRKFPDSPAASAARLRLAGIKP